MNKGDLIGVAYNNYIYPAIYIKDGVGGNPHFYAAFNEFRVNNIEEYAERGIRPRVDYINRVPLAGRFGSPYLKLEYSALDDVHKVLVDRTITALKKIGIL